MTQWIRDGEAEKPISLLVQLVGREGTDRPVLTMTPFIVRETLINTIRDTRLSLTCSSGACRGSGQGTYTRKQVVFNVGRENDSGVGGEAQNKLPFFVQRLLQVLYVALSTQ